MPTTPEWSPASLVTAAAGAAAHSRRLTEARKDGSEEDVAKKTSLPPLFGASRLDSPLLPNAPFDAPDDARSPATTATALKAAAKAAAAAASRGTFLKGEPPAQSPGERLGDEVARVAGSFLSFATSTLDRVDALRGRAEAAEEAERARARYLWMLSSPQRAGGVRETKKEVLEALDACEAVLLEAEIYLRDDERAPPDTHDCTASFGEADLQTSALCDYSSSSDASSPNFSDLELSDEEEETREFHAASLKEALAKESRKNVDVARDARSVAAAAAAIADAATRGMDVCERFLAELERKRYDAGPRESEENADGTFGNDESFDSAAFYEEDEEDAGAAGAAGAAAADSGPLPKHEKKTVPGPSNDAALSAYIPKRLDRRHKRKTTPPKLKKPESAEKAETAVSRDGVAAPRAEQQTRCADLFADFAFTGTQKK